MKHLERARGLLGETYARKRYAESHLEAWRTDTESAESVRRLLIKEAEEALGHADLLIELLEEYIRKWESAQEEVLPS